MKAGFAKADITPRVGVELCGFGPFINRHSIGVRDKLWARAMAVSDGVKTLVLVSCDIIGVPLEITHQVRQLVREATALPEEAIMVHCTHTHSGPTTGRLVGWGDTDLPYVEILPRRIAQACVDAVGRLAEATLSHAEVPCEGIALNREYDRDGPPLEEVLQDTWRPAKPELTDTTCHVVKIESGDQLIGFFSSFSCHPVVCCSQTRYIHGDFPGVATNLLERENPGSIGLFLQGAQGDVNSCVVHKPEAESLLALDVIASRYANCVRNGLNAGKPLEVESVNCSLVEMRPSRKDYAIEELRGWLREKEAVFRKQGVTDEEGEVRMAAVFAASLRDLIGKKEAGQSLEPPTELQGFRLGPIALLGTPFEMFQAIKREFLSKSQSPIPIVMGITNDLLGYATDRDTAARGGYAADQVPLMLRQLPFTRIHDELVSHLVALEHGLL
ncbi:MAG: neutral/alkaline non-lysosomal ceramidase N-terminal domain-containing protein [Armatimonadetes bacterium]|nr:neutral/alkaline non-lysosomal ceramidase N-terminal domain-containing protein [Armatimonadota bacterium]